MFTGLVEGQGIIRELLQESDAIRLRIDMGKSIASGLAIGDSVCINGCCLTVVEQDGTIADFQAGTETLSKTNLGRLESGSQVNLERSLPVDGRLGGHIVQGHIDGVAQVTSIDREGEWVTMWFEVPSSLAKFLVPKGSVAVDGISLTVVDVTENRFSVALIPHTLEVTTLGECSEGTLVNIETDILGRYVERLLSFAAR